MLVLTEKLAAMHAGLYGYEQTITEADLEAFIKTEFARIGSDTNITPREVIRDFIELLDIVWQNPGISVKELLESDDFAYAKSDAVSDDKTDEYAEFTI